MVIPYNILEFHFNLILLLEYLLGDSILVAPVIKQGATNRDIYLPKGTWYDPNQNKMYEGAIWLNDYPAPLAVLPYFIKNNQMFRNTH